MVPGQLGNHKGKKLERKRILSQKYTKLYSNGIKDLNVKRKFLKNLEDKIRMYLHHLYKDIGFLKTQKVLIKNKKTINQGH